LIHRPDGCHRGVRDDGQHAEAGPAPPPPGGCAPADRTVAGVS